MAGVGRQRPGKYETKFTNEEMVKTVSLGGALEFAHVYEVAVLESRGHPFLKKASCKDFFFSFFLAVFLSYSELFYLPIAGVEVCYSTLSL